MSKITLRDFVNVSLIAAGTAVLPSACSNISAMASLDSLYFPPSLTGLRGSHPGSNTHAHSRAWSQQTEWGPVSPLEQQYDLIVVGGGISGLAAYVLQIAIRRLSLMQKQQSTWPVEPCLNLLRNT